MRLPFTLTLFLLLCGPALAERVEGGGLWSQQEEMGDAIAIVQVHREQGRDAGPWAPGDVGVLTMGASRMAATGPDMLFEADFSYGGTAGEITFEDTPGPFWALVVPAGEGRTLGYKFTVSAGRMAFDRGEVTFDVLLRGRPLDGTDGTPFVQVFSVTIPIDETRTSAATVDAPRQAPAWGIPAGIAFAMGACAGLALGAFARRNTP